MAVRESPKEDWSDVFRRYADAFYESRKDTIQPVKPDEGISPKMIALIALAALFASIIVGISCMVLWRWLTKRRDDKKELKPLYEKIGNNEHDLPHDLPPKHINLMRADSSLSEISRDDSSYTPMSPLSEEDTPPDPFQRGRLEFWLQFNEKDQRLKATMVQAHGLPQRNCVFYVEGFLLPDKTSPQKTSVRYHNPSPIFEEAFKYNLPYSELPERTLCLRLYELDSYSQETMLGRILYSFDLDANDYKMAIKMDLELSPSLPNDNDEQRPIGEVLLSLCYLPTSGRLTLVVLKCRISQTDNGLAPDPFLNVSLVLNRKQVKKIKTSVKRKTTNAVYNEAFIFDVPTEHIANVGLYARIFNDRDGQGILGRVVIGPQAKTSMGVHHWECMLLSPRKPIAQWHSIMTNKK